MLIMLRQRNFRRLWLADLISLLGDWILAAALPFYVYQRTGSALATGSMFIAAMVPHVLFGSLAGVFVDRWDRRRTMIISDLARAGVVLLLFSVQSQAWFWLIYPISFVQTTISLFFVPAKGALIPQLLEKQDLVKANALGSVSSNFCRLIGPVLGGALLGLLGLTGVILIDVASYLISAILIGWISIPPAAPAPTPSVQQKAESAWIGVWQDWISGLKMLRHERWLGWLCVMLGASMFAQGIVNVLLVVFVEQVLQGSAQTFGWLMSVQGIGGLIGGLVIGQVSRVISPARLLALSLGTVGLIFLVVVNVPVLGLVLVLLSAIGIPVVGWMVSASTLFQQGVEDAYRGRILGAFGTTQSLLLLFGMGLATMFSGQLGVTFLLNVAGFMWICSGIAGLILESLLLGAMEPSTT